MKKLQIKININLVISFTAIQSIYLDQNHRYHFHWGVDKIKGERREGEVVDKMEGEGREGEVVDKIKGEGSKGEVVDKMEGEGREGGVVGKIEGEGRKGEVVDKMVYLPKEKVDYSDY
ncbi:unnamed protein product [Rhizophagus irregularis]|uniref:Uncharacterized protein n=1 Tax=Rhizophagus irregularis TaxID=588596 RepID=A0A915ZLC8_9GLOM|nr:unnamed protein product [Rhizophagus irregularis]CAB5378714.1 unnamed protein product [Rhizophagus irregularis]